MNTSGKAIADIESSRQSILNLMQEVKEWWSQQGYRYHTGTVFTEDGHLLVTFRVSVEARDADDQEAFVDGLRNQGYTIGGEDADVAFMVDNSNNRKIIRRGIKERFPSAKIIEWSNNCQVGQDKEDFLLKEIKVRIMDITEI